ncbi:MAG: hypothetical protein ACI976_000132 [Aureispira sp.]|jgi:hypothetical protein
MRPSLESTKKSEKTEVQIMDTLKYNPNHSINGLRLGYGSIDHKV